MLLRRFYFAFVVFIWAGLLQADTITVGPGGAVGGYDYAAIQNGINAANPGDIIIVAPGTYYENIDFNGNAITVKSVDPDDPNIVANTTIDANGVGSVVKFVTGEDRDSVLQGFTITGGAGTWYDSTYFWGGGIFCNESSPIISHNIIVGNSAEHRGGGIYVRSGNPLLYKNKITNNSAGSGGAIYMAGPTEFYNNVVCGNNADIGGGLYINAGGVTVANNLIYSNNATLAEAGGIKVHRCDPVITGNTIVGNSCVEDGASNLSIHFTISITVTNNIIANGLNCPGVYFWYSPSIIFTYNNVWNNEGGNYTGISDLTGTEGNISVDPLFIDMNLDNYHLQSDSGCINAGDPAFIAGPNDMDIDDEPRVFLGRIDIGADEFSNNLMPVADAGEDQSFSFLPSSVILDGGDSFDPDSGIINSYTWAQIKGPEVALIDPCSVNPYFEPVETGIYVFELIVSDDSINSKADTVGIVIGNHAPVADAGLTHYTTTGPVNLDGSYSYDPDGYGALSYQWTQVSGPILNIAGANTVNPLISGFSQTTNVQECIFELVVSDGDLTSEPDIVSVIIVPYYGNNALSFRNPPFDPNRPTILAFGGGNCSSGGQLVLQCKWQVSTNWFTTNSYNPPYDKYSDMLIIYLSSMAPDYKQPIQTIGFSTGNMPAIDVANRLNSEYSDPRYAVNHVSLIDAACRGSYSEYISTFLDNPVDSEQCWIENYIGTFSRYYPNTLNIAFGNEHSFIVSWVQNSQYDYSWPNNDIYNGGVTAGFYYSVAGPGKNLQLATDTSKYYFRWVDGDPNYLVTNGSPYPGKLPEAVTLLGPANGTLVDANGTVLSCQESQNAIGYQLLFGHDPGRVMDYEIVSDTPVPPNEIITELPFEETWWTVRAYDQYGSTIHADPRLLLTHINTAPVANAGLNKIVTVNSRLSLYGGASDDPDGDLLTYRWNLVSVPAGSLADLSDANIVNPSFMPDLPGEYVISLVVNDSLVDSEPDYVTVTVLSLQAMSELADFVDQWLNINCSPANDWCSGSDLDSSTEVDFIDFAIFANSWHLY